MKNKINIYSDKKSRSFLSDLFFDYELFFRDLIEIPNYPYSCAAIIIFLSDEESTKLIDFEKLTNINNNSFCYLTKLESKILTYLIIEKESTKKHIQENILNIKSTIQTSSLDSHLTRIRKKMNQIETDLKIQSKNETLTIII